tara:strand:+ start:749 stop:1972 length:1224 start_codon:yes stop_codon:yes gene_type:complete
MQNFMGKDGFVWWQGVVEDVDDPLMLGRCRVRCLGWHTDDKSLIKTEDLPWAYPIQPITSAAMSGMGFSPTGLVPGSWVVGFFRDGENAQEPVMMGSIGGIPEEAPDNETGFNDPRDEEKRKKDPKGNMIGKGQKKQIYYKDGRGAIIVNNEKGESYPKAWAVEEPDTNRLARNEKIDETIVQLKKDNLDKDVPTSDITCESVKAGITKKSTASKSEAGKWTEPKTAYDVKYPHNHVYESESGHTFEVDDTPNRERLHKYHRTGTFEEIHPNGDRVIKVVRNDYTVILKNECIHIDGWTNVTMDKACKIFVNADKEDGNHLDIHVGNKANLNIEVNEGEINTKIGKGDMNVELADGSFYTHVNGDFEHYVSGDYNLRVDGQLRTQSGKNTYMNAGPDIHLNHPGFAG